MSNPQSVAAANALSGEKTFETAQYPITGDPQLDLISGCLAVLNGGNGPTNLNTTGKICVLKYLLDRFTKNLEWEKSNERQYAGPQGIGQGYAVDKAKMTPYPNCPQPYRGTNPQLHDHEYITTSGSLPPQANIANDPHYSAKIRAMIDEYGSSH